MKRKTFLGQLGLLSISSAFIPKNIFANTFATTSTLKNIGAQLWSLPKLLEDDFEGTIALLSNMGYKEVELYGPYPFSEPAAQERWKSLEPLLGFSASGYFGRKPEEIKTILGSYGMLAPSMHTDLGTLENRMPQLGEAANKLGAEFVVLPAIPEERRKTLDDYKRLADTFNKIGEEAKKSGVKFTYHNHGYGLSPVDGKIPLEIILDGTDPELVFLEMDIFWTIAGKADPKHYLNKYSGRYRCMHVKDMAQLKTFAGDGGNPQQWTELFPNMTSAGKGIIDFESILPVAMENGVEHFFVEQDLVKDPKTALKESADFLLSM